MNDLETRLEHADARVDQARAILDAIGRTLRAAERAQSAAEQARSTIRFVNVVLVASVVALGVIGLVMRRRHEPDAPRP